MADNEEGEESTGRGNGWEVVSLTASAYAAAPGPREVELSNDDESGRDGELAETSRALFMSGHFVFPPNQHENLPLEPEKSAVEDVKVQKDAVDEIKIEEGGRSRGKEEENLNLKGLDVSDEFAGIQFTKEKDNRYPIGGTEFGEGTALEGLHFDDSEQAVYGAAKFGFDGETVLRGSSTYGDNTDIPGITEPSEQGLDLSGDTSQSPRPMKDDKFDGSDLPCGAWWKRRAYSLYSHAKEANACWSIIVAAAVMGLVILGQRWQNEGWQALQQKWQSSDDQKAGRILAPISRLKDIIVGGQRHGSFIGGSAPIPNIVEFSKVCKWGTKIANRLKLYLESARSFCHSLSGDWVHGARSDKLPQLVELNTTPPPPPKAKHYEPPPGGPPPPYPFFLLHTRRRANLFNIQRIEISLVSRASCLYFSYHLFLKTKTNSYDKTNSDDDNAEIFADSVNRAINTRRSAIQTFSLSFIYVYHYIDRVEDCLRAAVTRLHARELHLDFFIHEEYHEKKVQDDEFTDEDEENFGLTYAFLLSLLNNASVQVLRLTYCFLEWPEDNMTMSFGSVMSIFLDMIYLTDLSVPLLIEWCPNLEELELKNILGLRNLRIISPRLKKVTLEYIYETRKSSCKSVVIDCPNLLTLRFHDCDADRIVLVNATSVVEFAVDFSVLNGENYHVWCKTARLLRKARNVQKLKVTNMWFKLLTPENLFSKTLKLRNLKYLELQTGYTRYDLVGMAALLERCPNLESMVLSSVSTVVEDEV
ncbi:hypothetical protein ACLB2K_072047 [Fragaria x ananassa]